MARIPSQIATRSLDTGSVVSYPSGSPIGSAIEGLGNSIQGVAERFQQKQDQKDNFDATIRENEMLADIARQEDEAVKGAPADGAGIHDSVYGEIDPVTQQPVRPGSYDKLFDNYMQRVPESKRAEFAAKRELYRMKGSARLAGQQYDSEQAYYKVEIQKTQNEIVNGITLSDPNDIPTFEAYKKNGFDIIEKSGLQALDKEVARANWDANASIAHAESILANDPEGAQKLKGWLGFQEPESPVDTPAGTIKGFEARLVTRESGGRANIVNSLGYAGLYQFGAPRMADLGIYNPQGENLSGWSKRSGTTGKWTGEFNIPGHPEVKKLSDFLASPAAQRTAFEIHRQRMDKEIADRGLESFIGQTVGGVQITRDGIHAMMHLGGAGGAAKALRSGGAVNAADANGTTLLAYAKMGTGTGGSVDPRFASMTAEQRQAMAKKADSVVADRRVEQRGDIEVAVANAPLAIQMTGQYSGQMPSQQQFIGAYGEQQGAEKFNQFQAAVETSSRVHEMQTMPASSIEALVAESAPTSSGNDIAAQNDRYQVLAKAADATVKAREADPAAYVQRAFPTVATAWENATDPAGMQRAIAATVAAQQQLGVSNIAPLPKEIAGDAVVKFKDATLGETERFAAVTDIFMATPDPTQRKAIFDQMVEAGLPDVTDGAFVALDRGDTGAARRLFQAAMTDISKLPGQAPFKPAEIDEAIERLIMADEQIGDIYYGMADGAIENTERAQRDSKLLANAVNIRVRNGEPLDAAVSSVAKDLYGDVKPVLGDGRTGAQILIPKDVDEAKVMDGLTGLMPAIEERLRQALTVPDDAPAADGSRAIMNAAGQNEVSALMSEGYFRNIANGYMFFLPRLGAVAGDDGEPLVFTMDDILAAGVKKPRDVRTPDAPLTDDDFDAFQKRMQQ